MKTIKTILLIMVGIDLLWHILELVCGFRPYTFPTMLSYEIFWTTYWGIAFLLLIKLRFNKK
jgi:cell shape-determining protein MreD